MPCADTFLKFRLARNGHWYTAAEFREYYGHSWEQFWNDASTYERRRARDGHLYTALEFHEYYGDAGEQFWYESGPIASTSTRAPSSFTSRAQPTTAATPGVDVSELAVDVGNVSQLAAKHILLHPSMFPHVRKQEARLRPPRSLHKLAREALNDISLKTTYSDEDLENWFHWIPYVAAHVSCDDIVGPGIIRAMACFLPPEIASRDSNRGGAPRCDFCFIRRDGSVCRLHPGNKTKGDARLIIHHGDAARWFLRHV